MNGAQKLFLLFVIQVLPGMGSLLARDLGNKEEAAEAIEAFRKMDEWDTQSFQPIVARDKRELEKTIGPLPEGSSVAVDLDADTLVVRSTREGLERTGYFCEHVVRKLPRVVTCKLEVFESEVAADEALLDSLAKSQDHESYAKTLREQFAKGQARLIAHLQGQGQTGQLLKLEQKGDDAEPMIKFEITPTLGESEAVDLKMLFQSRDAPSPAEGADELRQAATVKATFRARIGASRAVAMWKPARDGLDTTRTAILVVNAHPLFVAMTDRLNAQVRRLDGGKPSPVPEISVPEGMELRTFPCPLSLFGLGNTVSETEALSDPFASSSEQAPEVGKVSWRARSAEEVLKQQGIPLPKGSRAYWHRRTARLVALNTPENLEMIEVFAESMSKMSPITMVHDFLVVQGERALMQSLADETRGHAHHTAAWRRMNALLAKGDLKRTGFLRSETSSGCRLFLFAGLTNRHPAQNEDSGPVKNATRLEVDATMGPDGRTIDLDLAIGQHRGPTPSGSVVTSTSMLSGSPRLIYLWNLPDPDAAGRSMSQAVFLRVTRFEVTD